MRSPYFLIAMWLTAGCTEQPKHATWATVVDIAPGPNPKWDSDYLVVTVRSKEGLLGYKKVPQARFACHVGDTVRATSQGFSLSPDEQVCRR